MLVWRFWDEPSTSISCGACDCNKRLARTAESRVPGGICGPTDTELQSPTGLRIGVHYFKWCCARLRTTLWMGMSGRGGCPAMAYLVGRLTARSHSVCDTRAHSAVPAQWIQWTAMQLRRGLGGRSRTLLPGAARKSRPCRRAHSCPGRRRSRRRSHRRKAWPRQVATSRAGRGRRRCRWPRSAPMNSARRK